MITDRTATLAPRNSAPPEAGSEAGSEADADADADLATETADDPDRYDQVTEHARGGLGRVVRAFDKRLGRTVAVKELLRRGADDEARFLREAMITARLQHPGIVPVHEAGRWPNGDPYYVMKLVSGRTLKELLVGAKSARARLALLPHAIAVADAVGYAHSEGVIHRDLKPSNIVIGDFGETVVVDWGLARDRSRDVPEPAGKVIGTPAYMSPEQARGDAVDERADVYAIGAVLYELLAGTPPHGSAQGDAPADIDAAIARVLAGPPRPLASIAPHAPDELVTIASKAIACDPAARYRNASALAEDLRRYQTGQLVSAHSYTTWSLMRRKLVRNRAAVAVAAAGVLALGAVGVASVRRVVAERNIARNERTRAESALSSAEQRQRQLVLLQAVTSLRKDPTAALAWLKLAPVSAEDRAQVVDVIDEAVAAGVAHQVFRPGDWVFDTVFAPDGRSVIVGARDGRLRSYDLATGAMRELGRAPSAPAVLALQPGGDAVAAGGWMGDVTLWPIAGGAPRTLAASGAMVSSLRFSADGTHLLVDRETGVPEDVELVTGKRTPLGDPAALHVEVATEDWRRRVVLATPNEVARPDGTPLAQTAKAITFLGLSPRGDTVIVHDGALVSAVPSAGGALRPLVKYDGKLAGAEFSPDRTTIALFGQRPEIVLVELATGASRELRGHTDQIYSAQFTHDGRTLLTASDDGTARVWNLRDGSALELRGHDDDVYRARFSADERQVATSSLDGSVRVWSLDQPGPRVFTEGAPIESLAIVGDRVVTKTAGAVAAWDLATGTRDELFAWSQDPHGLGVGVASPDGTQLLVPLADWSMEIRRHGAPPVVLRGHHGQISHVEWSRDGASLYSSSLDGSLRRWNVASGDGVALVDGDRPVKSFAVGADGRVVAQVGDDAVEISATGTSHVLGSGPRWCAQAMEFEQVRDRLVLRRCDSTLALVDHGRTIELATDGYAVSRTAVSADGRRLAGAMGDRTVRVWDAQTGELRKVLRGHSDLVMDVAFSPDGSQLASASYDKTVWIWQLETGRHRVLRGHGGAVERVAWSDRRLVTGSRDGTVRVWDVPSLAPPTTAELTARLAAATTAAIDRDDRPTTTSSDQPPQKLDLGAMLDRSFAAGHS